MKTNNTNNLKALKSSLSKLLVWVSVWVAAFMGVTSLFTQPYEQQTQAFNQRSPLERIASAHQNAQELFTCVRSEFGTVSYAVDALSAACILSQDMLSWYWRLEEYASYPVSQLEFLSTLYQYEQVVWTQKIEDNLIAAKSDWFEDTAIAMYSLLETSIPYSPYAPMSDELATLWFEHRFQSYIPTDADGILRQDEFTQTLYSWAPQWFKEAFTVKVNSDLITWLVRSIQWWVPQDVAYERMRSTLQELLQQYSPYQIELIHTRYAKSLEEIVTILTPSAS